MGDVKGKSEDDDILLSKNSEAKENKKLTEKLPKHLKILYTGTVYASFMGFSLCRSMYGPNLKELQYITSSQLEEMSMVFTWLGAGGIVGSLTYGILFDLCPPLILFILSLLGLGFLTIFLPWCRQLPWMMTISALQSVIFTGISVGCNVMIFRLWRDKASPVLLGMHVLYTVGGFIAPMISEPFMLDPSSMNRTILTENSSSILHLVFNNQSTELHGHLVNGSLPIYVNPTSLEKGEPSSQIHYTYLLVGLYLLTVSLCNLILHSQVNKYNNAAPVSAAQAILFRGRRSTWAKYISWTLFLLFNMCFGGLEMTYSGFLFTFASSHVYMSNSASSLLVSMLFGSYSVGRFAGIFISQCIPTHLLLLCDLLCGLVSCATLSYYTTTSIPVLWGCTLLQGLGSSTIFVTALLWANEFLLITGRFTSTYVIAYTVGMMSWPALTGHLLQTFGPQWFPYITTILSLGCTLWFNCLWGLKCTHKSMETIDIKTQEKFASLQSLSAM